MKNDIENQNFAIFGDYVSDSVHNFCKRYEKKVKKCYCMLVVKVEISQSLVQYAGMLGCLEDRPTV